MANTSDPIHTHMPVLKGFSGCQRTAANCRNRLRTGVQFPPPPPVEEQACPSGPLLLVSRGCGFSYIDRHVEYLGARVRALAQTCDAAAWSPFWWTIGVSFSRISRTSAARFTRYQQLLACARGEMFGPGNARLPAPPMLMFDRITRISDDGGALRQGRIRRRTRYPSGPVVLRLPFRRRPGDARLPGPGCDVAAGRLLPAVAGRARPRPRAGRGRGEVHRPGAADAKLVSYEIDVRRVMRGKLRDGHRRRPHLRRRPRDLRRPTDLRVGLFQSTEGLCVELRRVVVTGMGIVSLPRQRRAPASPRRCAKAARHHARARIRRTAACAARSPACRDIDLDARSTASSSASWAMPRPTLRRDARRDRRCRPGRGAGAAIRAPA